MTRVIDPVLVTVLLLNFFALASTRLQFAVYAVAVQGILLGLIYPAAHGAGGGSDATEGLLDTARLVGLVVALVVLKGYWIPRLLLQAARRADVRWGLDSVIGMVPALVAGAIGTGLAMVYAGRLPLKDQISPLIVPASLATVLTGCLLLCTRKVALNQVLGYVVLENGVFIFGLLLVRAVPIMVELGMLMDLFVCVLVMGVIIHHVSRVFPAASTEHLTALRE